MHSISHSSASISAWRGERLARTFLTPNSPSNPSTVLSHLCPEKISFSFQEPTVKHHLHGIDGRVVTSMCRTFLCSFNICASAQNVDCVSAKLSVSLGSISRLLKNYYFFISKYIIVFMQTDDHPSAEKLSIRDNPYLWRERAYWKNSWIWWYLWESPNLKCWMTFKKHMVYRFIIDSTPCTTYISMYPPH